MSDLSYVYGGVSPIKTLRNSTTLPLTSAKKGPFQLAKQLQNILSILYFIFDLWIVTHGFENLIILWNS